MSNNEPYQKYCDCNYFETREGTYATEKGVKNYRQTLITGKGQIYFSERLKTEQ